MTYRPLAQLLCDEYMYREDLDGDGLIFGEDFFFIDLSFTQYPIYMRSAVRHITKRIELGHFNGRAISIHEYLSKRPRDVRLTAYKTFLIPESDWLQ